MNPRPGQTLAHYTLDRKIGEGGMGVVWRALDTRLDRYVAIKFLPADVTADPERRRRFLREASIQGRLEHPAIVPVHELGRDDDGLPFFVMKKLSGITLGKILADPATRARIGLQRILRAFVEVCLAIELAHVRGIVHRDLKPDNILLGDFGEVYILDWGVAKVKGDAETDPAESVIPPPQGVEATRGAVGTYAYMAPEQAEGEVRRVDRRSDVFGLGAILYEVLTGRAPYAGGNLAPRQVSY